MAYGTKLIRDKLKEIHQPKKEKAKGILKKVYDNTIISTSFYDDQESELVDKFIEDNVLRQIGPNNQYTWHSPFIKSGYEKCTIYYNTIIYNNL